MEGLRLLTAFDVPPSLARTTAPTRHPLRVGAVQDRWHGNAETQREAISQGVRTAVDEGAELVCLQELTLSPYFPTSADALVQAQTFAEPVPDGPTTAFARELATSTGAWIHASLFERVDGSQLGYNTAICVDPSGDLISQTRKGHIPKTAGYHEDRYFQPGDSGHPVANIRDAQVGFPTCWDQCFPESARAFSLEGAELIVYPTAIGSEPDHPDFDTEPLWEKVITANGIANGTFMVAVNRIGSENGIQFYGSSFISDPYGRILVQAPRDERAVIVADVDLDQRRDWLELFPFLETRRPDTYEVLTRPPKQ